VFPTAATIHADTGLPGRPLVVEHEGPRARHLSVLTAQLVGPFRPMHRATDRPPVRADVETPKPIESDHVQGNEVPTW
jgi:hypothetical protein